MKAMEVCTGMDKYYKRDKDLFYLGCVICAEIDKIQKHLETQVEPLKDTSYNLGMANLFYLKDKWINLSYLP